ncbi:MAG: 30S ribosomal protein S15 [Alphaproteobacteria bacterium MarineAlpha5_Bin9]|nr:MAG: 30S ribosomal protein S15 [Alphaproteobacteria bacterium MarineAlpha5_Bin9]|tara:strand:+ start:13175 stop:13450 length:276 start_codon:yes stop_codon:yes gene_type:complete
MSIDKNEKKEIISKFAVNENDTGSTVVQIVLLTKKIQNLTEHFKKHKGDNHSKMGLLAMVNRRKKLLSYLHRKDNQKYKEIVKEFNIRSKI